MIVHQKLKAISWAPSKQWLDYQYPKSKSNDNFNYDEKKEDVKSSKTQNNTSTKPQKSTTKQVSKLSKSSNVSYRDKLLQSEFFDFQSLIEKEFGVNFGYIAIRYNFSKNKAFTNNNNDNDNNVTTQQPKTVSKSSNSKEKEKKSNLQLGLQQKLNVIDQIGLELHMGNMSKYVDLLYSSAGRRDCNIMYFSGQNLTYQFKKEIEYFQEMYDYQDHDLIIDVRHLNTRKKLYKINFKQSWNTFVTKVINRHNYLIETPDKFDYFINIEKEKKKNNNSNNNNSNDKYKIEHNDKRILSAIAKKGDTIIIKLNQVLNKYAPLPSKQQFEDIDEDIHVPFVHVASFDGFKISGAVSGDVKQEEKMDISKHKASIKHSIITKLAKFSKTKQGKEKAKKLSYLTAIIPVTVGDEEKYENEKLAHKSNLSLKYNYKSKHEQKNDEMKVNDDKKSNQDHNKSKYKGKEKIKGNGKGKSDFNTLSFKLRLDLDYDSEMKNGRQHFIDIIKQEIGAELRIDPKFIHVDSMVPGSVCIRITIDENGTQQIVRDHILSQNEFSYWYINKCIQGKDTDSLFSNNNKNFNENTPMWQCLRNIYGQENDTRYDRMKTGARNKYNTMRANPQHESLIAPLSYDQICAIYLYTTSLLYRELSNDINRDHNGSRFADYVCELIVGINKLPMQWTKTYRGFSTRYSAYPNFFDGYQNNNILRWDGMNSTSTQYERARSFASSGKGIEMTEGYHGRDIEPFSHYPGEKEVIYIVSTHFYIIGNYMRDNKRWFKVREMPFPWNSKAILWVDDKPSNNKILIERLERQGKMIIPRKSTQAALDFLKFMKNIFFKNEEFNKYRIITDMTRYERKDEYDENSEIICDTKAGATLVKKLRDEGYVNKVCIYTSKKQKAIDECTALGCYDPNLVVATVSTNECYQFCQY